MILLWIWLKALLTALFQTKYTTYGSSQPQVISCPCCSCADLDTFGAGFVYFSSNSSVTGEALRKQATMVMKLYGMQNIFNVQRAILPLFETEVDTEKELQLVKVSLFTQDNLQPAYTAKQPFAVIPFFEDGDVAIFESRAIARYIAEKYDGQGTPLLGKTLKERAAINQWVESEAHNFYPPLAPLFKEIYVARAMNRPMDEELISTFTAQLCKVLDVYEAHLSSKGGMKYLTGNEFTFADVMHTPYLWQVKQHKAEVLEPRPHVAAYAARITARPAFQKCLQLNWGAAQPLR